MKYTIKHQLRGRTLYITGMTCDSCQTRIERRLARMEGIVKTEADYPGSKVKVVYDIKKVSKKRIVRVLDKLGYATISNPKRSQGKKARYTEEEGIDFGKLIFLGIIVYLIYQTLQNLGVYFLPQIDQTMGYGILFIVGLLTSLHCIAMCGGINLYQCMGQQFDKESQSLAKFKPSLLYNTGRVVSYTVIGGIVGAIGSVVSFSGVAKGLVAVIAGVIMVIMGLNILNVFPALKRFNPRMPRVFSRLSGENRKRGPFIVGLFNGLMPCGPLQAMQIYALGTGSMIIGATSMFFFSLGTVPLMFGLGAISSFLSGQFTRRMLRTSAVLVIVLGMIMFNRGLGLSGISAFAAGTSSIASVKGDIQVVTTSLESGRYTPITVQKGVPVKWTIQVDSDDLNGCNNPVTIPKYNLEKELRPGDNIIEFTPDKTGNIVYTCWMGMIRSTITVVDDISTE